MKKGVHNSQKAQKDLNFEKAKERNTSSGDDMAFLNEENFDLNAYLEQYGLSGEKPTQAPSAEFTVFSNKEHSKEIATSQEIQQLTALIRQELKELRRVDNAISSEIKDIERTSLEYQSEKSGIYHVRFLETILSIIHDLRLKVSEGQTWLTAINNRRNKRGYSALSKSKGTQYSLSSEHSVARNTQ